LRDLWSSTERAKGEISARLARLGVATLRRSQAEAYGGARAEIYGVPEKSLLLGRELGLVGRYFSSGNL